MQQTKAAPSAYPWRDAYYPVAFIRDLNQHGPNAVTIMGDSLVVWLDNDGTWRCAADRCPHRLVPLSEGRVNEAGNIECGYHGWSFAGDGHCVSIPQAGGSATGAAAAASPRACVRVYPTAVAQGMLFVRPSAIKKTKAGEEDDGPQLPLPTIPELDAAPPELLYIGDISREMQQDFLTLVENIGDIQHLPYTHHGSMQGASREKGALKQVFELTSSVTLDGFHVGPAEGNMNGMPSVLQSKTQFVAPCLARHINHSPLVGTFLIIVYGTPIAPGRCRLFLRGAIICKSVWARRLLQLMRPQWVGHLGNLDVFNDDDVFLHIGEKTLQAEMDKGLTFEQAAYNPTPADTFVLALHKWRRMAGAVPWAPGTPTKIPQEPIRPRQAVLDRYESHVKGCKICSGALRNVRLARWALGVAGVVAAASAVMGALLSAIAASSAAAAAGASTVLLSSAATSPLATAALVALGIAAAALFGVLRLGRLEKRFLAGPYPPPRSLVVSAKTKNGRRVAVKHAAPR